LKKINLEFLIIGLSFLLPIFISIGNNSISLSRISYYENSEYLFTIPISLFFVIYFFKQYFIQALKKLIFSNVFLIISFLLIMHFVINFKFDYLFYKHIISLLLFIFIIYISEIYFYKKLYYINIVERLNKYDYLCFYPVLCQILIILISYESYGKGAYIHKDILIFNFEQYLAIVFIPALYVFRNIFFSILIGALIVLVIYKSNNYTGYLIICAYICLLLMPKKIFDKKTQVNLIKITFYFVALCGIFYWIIEIDDYFLIFLDQGGYGTRVQTLEKFWLNLEFYNFFFPFLKTHAIFNFAEYHNQYYNFYHTFGLFSVYFLWKLVKFTSKVYEKNKQFAFLIFSLFSIGSFTINTILHPYLLIYFATLIGFISANINLNNEKK
jgi:hypothetical protein